MSHDLTEKQNPSIKRPTLGHAGLRAHRRRARDRRDGGNATYPSRFDADVADFDTGQHGVESAELTARISRPPWVGEYLGREVWFVSALTPDGHLEAFTRVAYRP